MSVTKPNTRSRIKHYEWNTQGNVPSIFTNFDCKYCRTKDKKILSDIITKNQAVFSCYQILSQKIKPFFPAIRYYHKKSSRFFLNRSVIFSTVPKLVQSMSDFWIYYFLFLLTIHIVSSHTWNNVNMPG